MGNDTSHVEQHRYGRCRSRSRDRRGRSRSRDRRGRSRSGDRRGRSRSRDCLEQSRSRDRREQPKSSYHQRPISCYYPRSKNNEKHKYDRSDRSDYCRYDKNSRDCIDYSRLNENYNSPRDSYDSRTFLMNNLTDKYKSNKPSSTVTSLSSDTLISAVQFTDTYRQLSKTEAATKSFQCQQTYYLEENFENHRKAAKDLQYQMEENTNPNHSQLAVSSQPKNPVKENYFAHPKRNHIIPISTTHVPPPDYLRYRNYARNVNDYRSSVNDNVPLSLYQQSSSTNAHTNYGQHKQNRQVAPGVSKVDISKSYLDKVYRSGEDSIPSLYNTTNSASSVKFRIPKKKPISTVTQDIHATGYHSKAASDNQKQSNISGGFDSADLQCELSGNIDQRKKSSEIQGSSVDLIPSVLPEDQSTAKKNEVVESCANPNGLLDASGLLAFISLCGKLINAVQPNEVIQTPATQTERPNANPQNDIDVLTATKSEKIVPLKKSNRKRTSSCRRPRGNSRSTKSTSQNETDNPPLTNKKNIKKVIELKDDAIKSTLKVAVTKRKLKTDVIKTKHTTESPSTSRNAVVSYAEQESDSSEPHPSKKPRKVAESKKRIVGKQSPAKRLRFANNGGVTLNKLKTSVWVESSSPCSTSNTSMIKNKHLKEGAANIKHKSNSKEQSSSPKRLCLTENRKRLASEVVPTAHCRSLRTKSHENRTRFIKIDDVKPKSKPSTIKNNNPEWHCLNQKLECLHCDKYRGVSLANHYVTKHPDCEVFPSRLSPDIAAFLRNTTEAHKCERQKYEYRQRCYFCDKFKLSTKIGWLQHISVHTGCYEFKCRHCDLKFSKNKGHVCINSKNCVKKFKYPPFHRDDGTVYGYVCDLCNFVRFEQSEIEKHLRCEHEGKVDQKFRELVFLTFPKKKIKHEIEAEVKALVMKTDDDDTIVITTDDDDDDEITTVMKTNDDYYPSGQKAPVKEAIENSPILILDSDSDDDWISCTDEDERDDDPTINILKPSTSTQVCDVEKLQDIIHDVEEVNKEPNKQTTESLSGTYQQQNDAVSYITQSPKISNVMSLAPMMPQQQCSSSQTLTEFETTNWADISNEIFSNVEMMTLIEEMVESPYSTFSNIFDNHEIETLSEQQLPPVGIANTSMMQEIIEVTEKRSEVSTIPWTNMRHEIEDAAYNLVKGTGLARSELYRCCLIDCHAKYTDSSAFKVHLLNHDPSQIKLKCYHCEMVCKTIAILMHHIETHGIHQYFCFYCVYTNVTFYNVLLHMRDAHDEIAINSIQLNHKKSDGASDLFVVSATILEEEELVSFGSTLIERNKHKLLL